MTSVGRTGKERCWPCTVANTAVGVVIAGVPLAAAAVTGDGLVILGAIAWSLIVLCFTGYRLVTRGYLPLAEPVALALGLHERMGPGRDHEEE